MHDEATPFHTRLEILEHAIQAMQPVKTCGCSVGPDVRQAKNGERGAGSSLADRLRLIDALVAARRHRTKYFDHDLFFDPVWSILIDLYRAELTGQQLCVSSVCYGSGVAETTALRYIRVLEFRGLVERMPDPRDRRRSFLGLNRAAFEKLDTYFSDVSSGWSFVQTAGSESRESRSLARFG